MKTFVIVTAVLLFVLVAVLIGRGVSALAYERDHPTEANQWLTMFLPPRTPEMSRYFPDPKVAAFAADVRNGNDRKVRQALATGGIDVNAEGNEGFRPIFFAVYPHQDTSVLKLLLAAGADPNVHLSKGNTPLHMAAQLPTADHLAALLDAGADPNAPGEYNCPVVGLVGKDRGDMVRLLARHGADLNVVYSTRTPLISAVMSEGWVKAATLLEVGADPTCKDMHGRDAAAVFCERLQGLPASYEPNRAGVTLLAKAFADRGVQLPCAREIDKFR